MSENKLTIKDIIKKEALSLPLFEIEALVASALKKTREYLIAHQDEALDPKKENRIRALCKKRRSGLPVPYITARQEFFGLEFIVNKNVLIPRPETELLVEEAKKIAIDLCPDYIIDVGTGSGAIIVSLAKNSPSNVKSKFLGLDISSPALSLARRNAKKHSLEKIEFRKSDLLANLPLKYFKKRKILILANLPYLSKEDIKNSKSIKHEPRLALFGGHQGLFYYKKLLRQINEISKFSKKISLIIEIDPAQAKDLMFFAENLLQKSVKIKKDLRGQKRFIIIC